MKIKFLSLVLIFWLGLWEPLSAQEAATSPGQTAEADEESQLRRTLERSGSQQQLVVNLEEYLKKFPNAQRRPEIEREIYRLSLELRDRDRAIAYGERLLADNERDLEKLTTLVALLQERKKEGDLQKALGYADRLIAQVEAIFTAKKPDRISQEQWLDRKDRTLASIYLLRGKVYAELNQDEKAQADLLKSLKASPLSATAFWLGGLAEKRKAVDEAIDYYIQAFVLSLESEAEVNRQEVRDKLGRLYTSKQGTEVGLGDRILKAYDAYLKEREARLARIERPNINAGVADPLQFKLTRLDGSTIKLADFRGKVILVNFWATWCGPCLVEKPLLEKTMEKYQNDPEVVFLALSTDEDRSLVEPFLKKHQFKLPVAFADYLNEYYAVDSIPTTMIFDRQGQVSFRQAGFNPNLDLVAWLSQKIEEAKKK